MSLLLNTAQDAFEVLISIGAGTGLLYMLRWFWWRINAWCEVVAMVSSFAVTILFLVLKKTGHAQPFAHTVIYSVALTTLCWLVTAFVTPPTARETLVAFYRRVRPAGAGWRVVRGEAGCEDEARDSVGLAALGWVAGCAMIWSSLFAIGSFLYGRWGTAWVLTAIFVLSSSAVVFVMNQLWKEEN